MFFKPALLSALLVWAMLGAALGENDTSLTFNGNMTVVKAKRSQLLSFRSAGAEQWKMDSSSWACAAYDASKPWEAHGYLESYRSGNNAERANMMNVVSYPLVLVKSATENNLCMLIDQKSFCYPPSPNENAVKNVDTGEKSYFSRSFWGQASDSRVQHQADLLKATIATMGLKADTDTLYLSFWESQEREVRYNAV